MFNNSFSNNRMIMAEKKNNKKSRIKCFSRLSNWITSDLTRNIRNLGIHVYIKQIVLMKTIVNKSICV